MNNPRRTFIAKALTAATLAASSRLMADETKPVDPLPIARPPTDRVRPLHDPAVVLEFVNVCHRDFDRVKAMVAQDPKLVLASRDTGNIGIGDWESGLNGAAHTGHRDIAEFLLDHGARLDAFSAAMLGYRDMVLGMLKADPRSATVKGPHNLNLLYHIAISGDVVMADVIKPLLPADAKDYNQSLSAAARDGRLEMTVWLLANGATNVNAPDGFRKTPLKIALEKGFTDVAAVLREHGGKEVL